MKRIVASSILLFVFTTSCFGADNAKKEVLFLTQEQVNEMGNVYKKVKPGFESNDLLDAALDSYMELKGYLSISVVTIKGQLKVVHKKDTCEEGVSFLSEHASNKIGEPRTIRMRDLPFKSLGDFQKDFFPVLIKKIEEN